MKTNWHHLIFVALLCIAASVFSVKAQGKYTATDFHQHTTYSDGSYTFGYMMEKNNQFGLDWWVNSEHGGGFDRWGFASGADLGTEVSWSEAGIEKLGKANGEKMWRWQSLRDWSFRDIMLYRKVYPNKTIIQGFEWNAPGHEHVNVCIINNQFDENTENCLPIAEFEYKFDNNDSDNSNPNGWTKGTNTGKAKTLEAIQWLQTNYPNTSWVIPTHPERANAFKIEDFRNMNNAGPSVCFGFDSQPGHQKEPNRGGYRTTSYGANGVGATWGGTGYFAAKVGGVWDALLSEGRKWWLFANSDCHFNDNDFFPGEYQKTKVFVSNPKNPQSLVDGLRSGNSYVVMGDLIDSLSFTVGSAKMGETFVTADNNVVVSIIVHDPQVDNIHNTYSALKNPELDHIDLIAGKVTSLIDPQSPDYKVDSVTTTTVIARFGKSVHTDANGITTIPWEDLGNGYFKITYTVNLNNQNMYFRLRGTHHAFGDPNAEIDDKGNPLVDPFGQNTAEEAFNDLWFYSNPIFVTKSNQARISSPKLENIHIYPNPTKDMLLIQFTEPQTGLIKFVDMSGKCVLQSEIKNSVQEQISCSSLPKGLYFVKINNLIQKVILE